MPPQNQVGKINRIANFNTPLHATMNGRAVRLLATGDVEGMSPSYLYVDTNGQSLWAPINQFTIVDTTCLPASEESLRALGRAVGLEGQTSNR